MSRRRRYEEEEVELEEVLEPYQPWDEESEEAYPEYYEAYADPYQEEYSEEHESADNEGRFRFAMGLFDLISIFLGIVVILLLVAMLFSLLSWLNNDILHSALLMQSGLQ